MAKIGFFLDEPYYFDKKKEMYISMGVSGNFLKILINRLRLESSFIFPVIDNVISNRHATSINPKKYNVEVLPGWHSIISYYKYLLKPNNYFYIKRRINELAHKFDIFWIRMPSIFGLMLGKKAEKLNKFVLYNLISDIRLVPKLQRYKKIRIFAKILSNYLHNKSLRLGKNGVFLCTGSILYKTYKKAGKKAIYFIDSLIRNNHICNPKKSIGLPFKLLYVGRLIKEKGIYILINVVENLREKFNLELHIVGFNELGEEFYKVIKNKKYIKFHGFLQGRKLLDVYKLCDVFIFPSIYYTEGFPRVILEAWANGLFVISSRIGGIEGLAKDSENILFFYPGDELDLSEKIQFLIENYCIRTKMVSGIKAVQSVIATEYMIKKIKYLFKK